MLLPGIAVLFLGVILLLFGTRLVLLSAGVGALFAQREPKVTMNLRSYWKPSLHLLMVSSLLLILLALAGTTAQTTFADSITVPCDPNALISAINTANENPGSDTLDLSSGCTYTLTEVGNVDPTYGYTGLPSITGKVTINGHGATITRNSSDQFRFLLVAAKGQLHLNNLTLSGGLSNVGGPGATVPDGNPGPNNTPGDPGPPGNAGTNGLPGGAIVNLGSLILHKVTFTQNSSGYGGAGSAGGAGGTGGKADFDKNAGAGGAGGLGGNGGNSGNGGAIYNTGTLTDNGSTFTANTTGAGGVGGAGGAGGVGGIGSNTVTPITGHTSGGAGGAGGNGGTGGASGMGGAIYNDGGTVLLNGTQFQNDFAGSGGNGGNGGAGGNGGIASNNAIYAAGGQGGTGGTGGNGGDAGAGGAVFNAGSLTVVNAFFSDLHGQPQAPQGGNGGDGGTAGISSAPEQTFAGATGGTGGSGGTGGNGGDGGAIASTGLLTVSGTTFSWLYAGNGGNGGAAQNGGDATPGAPSVTGEFFSNGGLGGNGGDGGDAGNGGRGGAVAVLSGSATIVTSTLTGSGAGMSGAGQNGGNGGAGGVGITAPQQAGEGGPGGDGGNGGDAGVSEGGGIFNAGTLALANSTLVVNFTSFHQGVGYAGNGGNGGNGGHSVGIGHKNANLGGNAGNGGNGGSGGPGSFGGGLYNSGSAQVINVTLSQNLFYKTGGTQASWGNAGTPGSGLQPGKAGKNGALGAVSTSNGANLFNAGGTLQVTNTIVDNHVLSATPVPPFPPNQQTGPDCGGTITDGGNNLDADGSCSFSSGTTNPLLNSSGLADNGGPTQTIAIPTNSPAQDGGNNAVCASAPVNNVDQRGITRPQNINCNIGAYENEFTAQSNPYTVNVNGDQAVGTCNTTICTLRDAVNAANNLGSPATIQFSVTGQVNVTGEPIAITNNLNIVGPGDGNLTIYMADGQTQPQLFTIAPNLNVTISNVTVSNSNLTSADQATILNHGNLTLENFDLNGNASSTGPQLLDAYNINSDGTLNIVDSTFNGNTGAVIGSAGTLNVSGSTFYNNESFGNLMTLTGTSTIVNSTFTGNQLYQPVLTNSGPLTIVNSTFANDQNLNSGATEVQGTQITAKNSIFASATTSCAAAITDGGNNLDSGNSCGFSTSNNSLINTDPLLDPNGLLNNGGPTQTIALTPASPALGAGNNKVCTTAPVNKVDQRGVMRPQGQNCDSGAFELELQAQTNPFTVNTLADGPVSACTFANCTLRSAVAAATASGSPATINLGVPGTIALSGAKMALTHDLTIVGPTKTTVTLDLTNQPELFTTSFEANVTLSNVTIQNAGPGDQQTTINNQGNLTLNGVTFEDNLSPDGLFFLNNGTLNITNSTLSGNEGMLVDSDGFVNISASTLASNQSGGTLLNLSGITTVSNSTLTYNTQAGAVLAGDGSLSIFNSTLSQNTNSLGQGDDVQGSRVTATNSIFASQFSCVGSITDGGANIEDGNTCGFDTTKGSFVNTDPLLDPNGLQNNGGPTVTIALQSGSPAINAGIDSVCQAAPVNGVDQRGAARSKGAHCDIGAVEASISIPPPVCDSVPKTPALLKPGPNALVEPQGVVLKWQGMKCAAFYDVVVQRVTKSKPKRVLKEQTVNPRYIIQTLKESETYRWKVRACNAQGCGDWTEVRTFSTSPRKRGDTP